MKAQMKMIRKGELTNNTSGPNQCGTTGVALYYYVCTIRSFQYVFDERGFLIDNLVLHSELQAAYNEVAGLSCEEVTNALVTRISEVLRMKGHKVYNISLIIGATRDFTPSAIETIQNFTYS